jgi:Zinc finger, C4 type (two domains)
MVKFLITALGLLLTNFGFLQEFFLYTTENNLQYACEWEKKCVVDKFNREKCQYCWFSRCLDVGMEKSGKNNCSHGLSVANCIMLKITLVNF